MQQCKKSATLMEDLQVMCKEGACLTEEKTRQDYRRKKEYCSISKDVVNATPAPRTTKLRPARKQYFKSSFRFPFNIVFGARGASFHVLMMEQHLFFLPQDVNMHPMFYTLLQSAPRMSCRAVVFPLRAYRPSFTQPRTDIQWT